MEIETIEDWQGNKVLVEVPETKDFALISEPDPGRPGNPFHNTATGEFTFAPPGVAVIKGGNLLRQMSTNARKDLFARAQRVTANQLALRIIDGKLSIVLLRDGRRLHSYSIGPEGLEANAREQPELAETGGPIDILEFFRRRDAIVDAARQLNLTQTDIEEFIAERAKKELGDIEIQQLVKEIRAVQVDDLVDYLWYNIAAKTGAVDKGIVRISSPRGYLRKSFANVTEEEAEMVIERLRNRGVSESDIQESIIGKLPRRLRKSFLEPHKIKTEKEKSGNE